ncbi:MAG: hypothetical protein ACREPE_08335 [Lysobacter sp.]
METDTFHLFLQTRRGDLRRIASRTRGELSVDDLASEAWLLAIDIGHKRGWTFDFRDEEDQDTLFAWMHNRFVKYADKAVRNAIKLDRDWDNEDSERAGAALARLLTAPRDSDPQIRQQVGEEQHELVAIVRHSYSEAAAYVMLMVRVDRHIEDLAALLWIGVEALRQRLKASGLRARVQPSLFDGIEVIDADFVPWRRRRHGGRRGQEDGVTPQEALSL